VIASGNVAWYVDRAGGLVAFALLTVSVILGILLSGRARSSWPRFALEDVHRFAGILAGVFIAVHGVGVLLDGYFHFSLADLIVPGTAPYRPLATALGVVAAELLAALAVTNRLRKTISYAAWRRLHYLNFAVWLLALFHGIAAGSDSDTLWALAFYTVAAGSVAALTLWRVLRLRPRAAWELRFWPALSGIVAAEVVFLLALGLLHA